MKMLRTVGLSGVGLAMLVLGQPRSVPAQAGRTTAVAPIAHLNVTVIGKVEYRRFDAVKGKDYEAIGEAGIASGFKVGRYCVAVTKVIAQGGKPIPELIGRCLVITGDKAKEIGEKYENEQVQITGTITGTTEIRVDLFNEGEPLLQPRAPRNAPPPSTPAGSGAAQQPLPKAGAGVSPEEKKPTVTGHIEGLYKRAADLAVQVVGSPQAWPDILLPQCTADRLPGLRIPLYLREHPDKKFLITVRDAVAHDMAHAEVRPGGGCLVSDLAKSRGREVRISYNDKDLEILTIEFFEEGSTGKSR